MLKDFLNGTSHKLDKAQFVELGFVLVYYFVH